MKLTTNNNTSFNVTFIIESNASLQNSSPSHFAFNTRTIKRAVLYITSTHYNLIPLLLLHRPITKNVKQITMSNLPLINHNIPPISISTTNAHHLIKYLLVCSTVPVLDDWYLDFMSISKSRGFLELWCTLMCPFTCPPLLAMRHSSR